MSDTPPMPEKLYSIIYADPPWSYRDKALAGNRGAICKYPVMSLGDIQNLPVGELAATDACLFLWATMPLLPQAFKVLESWGFSYKSVAFVWVKRNRKALSWFWGMGNWTRANAELCLLGVKGRPKRISARVHSVVDTPVEGHSRKPAVVRERIVELCGDLPRIELFARERVDKWDAWGLGVDAPGPLFEGGK